MIAYGVLCGEETVSSEKVFLTGTMLSENGGNDSWEPLYFSEVVVLVLLLVISGFYTCYVCV